MDSYGFHGTSKFSWFSLLHWFKVIDLETTLELVSLIAFGLCGLRGLSWFNKRRE